ncbi:MAG TPA: hypothetical protein PLF75_12365, partial [Bacteroidales bacterium]|nr:hypothetical protein [Bacteroidales bacterium]
MGFIDKIVQKIFGSKSERDIKEIQPIIEKIHQEYEKIKVLSHDELRALSARLRDEVRASFAE